MIKVTLNVVGLYYGEVLDVESDNPTVLDVLRAAKGKTTNSGILEFEPNASPHENSILWIENDITGLSNPVSRKWRGDPTKARKLKKKVLRLTEGVFNQTASSKEMSLVSVAWQYYIEKARVNPPKVTTTYSIDDEIVDAGVSNSGQAGKKIENGDTVTLRLLCINTSLHGDNRSSTPDGLPPRK